MPDRRSSAEEEYLANSTAEKRKRLGQFFTPEPVARFMVRWATRGGPVERFLDPAFGAGVFARAYRDLCVGRGERGLGRVFCYEIDPQVLATAKRHLDGELLSSCRFRRQDFLEAGPSERFDAIVCNPPYRKHHFVSNKEAVARRLGGLWGGTLPNTLSSYGLFLLKSVTLLREGGRCAFITPSEYLNADYGVSIKSRLVGSGALRALIFFDPSLPVFDSALTTSAITLIEKSARSPDDRTPLIWIDKASSVERVFELLLDAREPARLERALEGLARVRLLRREALDPGKKWQSYFAALPELRIPLAPLSSYGNCRRGIATGANAYFTLSDREAEAAGLSAAEVLPCITKAVHVRGRVLTEEWWRGLKREGKKCWLLNVREPLSASARRYLDKGMAARIDRLYLPSHRPRWYEPERRPPADFLVPVFFRERWKIVLNEIALRNLTTFHGFYLNASGRRVRGPLFLYMNTPLCLEVLGQVVRRYGDGLNKVEPKDVEGLLVPDFGRLEDSVLARLRRLSEGLLGSARESLTREVLSDADRCLRACMAN